MTQSQENDDNKIRVNDELITRYLCGEATPEEAMALTDWQKEPLNAAYFEKLQKVWHATRPSRQIRPVDRAKAFAKLQITFEDVKPSKSRTLNSKMVLQIAAAIALLLTIGSLLYIKFSGKTPENITVSSLENSKHIILSDSSRITMYRNTSIIYSKNFNEKERVVAMPGGEAFFVITPDQRKPFMINTALGKVQVVGTAFNVSLDENRLEVGVSEGKVMIGIQTDTIFLNAGQAGTIVQGAKSITLRDSVNSNVWAYATQKLVFRETPLNEVVEAIEKTYQNKVLISNDQINKCKLTGTFDNISAENLINLIAETLNLSVSRNGTEFILEGEGCQ